MVAKSSALEIEMYSHWVPHIDACPKDDLRSAGWGQYLAAGIHNNWSSMALQTTHSPYLCPSSGCSSSLWLTFVSGCIPLLSETIWGVCPPCKSFDSPLSPGTHSENRYHARPRISHITSNFLFGSSSNLPWQNGLHASPNACHAQQCRVMS